MRLLTNFFIAILLSLALMNCEVPTNIDTSGITCTEGSTLNIRGEFVGSGFDQKEDLSYLVVNTLESKSYLTAYEEFNLYIPDTIMVKPLFDTPTNVDMKCKDSKWFLN